MKVMFKLPDLPYSYEALAPTLSPEAMHLHHDKHHAGYIEKTNKLLKEKGREATSLEDVVSNAAKNEDIKLFRQSAQAWNHAFYWHCMTPDKHAPGKALAAAIQSSFGGVEALRARFVDEGTNHFSSGWVWLVANQGHLSVIATHDADDILTDPRGITPLLVCDLWEHAYYIDYRNVREKFLKAWFDNLANWDFATAQFDAAQNQGIGWCFADDVTALVT
jgi:superoxide dismutase, Fe-Mn family